MLDINLLLLFLAFLQGLLEWWPISSSGVLLLISMFYGTSISTGYTSGLALHFASGLAVLTLYYRFVSHVFSELSSFRLSIETRNYLFSVFLSLFLGGIIYMLYLNISKHVGSYILVLIGIGLLVTTFFLLGRQDGFREKIVFKDWVVIGVLQGLAVLPGFSRSGLIIGYLCIRRYKPSKAVETSLILAIPVLILAGLYNMFITQHDLSTILLTQTIVYVTSILSAKTLLEFAKKTKTYIFTLVLAILVILSAILQTMY